ncbi:MAG: T9SS type A sorting domain-containing protein [Chitinophagaceae bacterium]|nr:T9SS type A sorting domain-containing protein [Chitinophagaceae bacterium]
MKTNFNFQNHNGSKNSKGAGYPPQKLSLAEAILWFVLTAFALCLFGSSNAQTAIVNVNTSFISSVQTKNYTAAGANGSSFSSANYQYTFGASTQATNHLKKLNSFIIGSEVYTYADNASSVVKIRRVNNTVVAGTRTLLWVEKSANATNSKIAVVNEYNDNMESVFDGNSLNQGTDNLFANQGDGNGNNNNIERLDVIFTGGVISTINSKVGFALFERGDDNAHDPFVIAPITAIDVNGNPTAYGNILRVNTASFGNLPSSSTNYYIVRKDTATEASLKMSTSGTQKIGGVFISLNDLGVAANVKIYGYSVIGYDLPSNATSLNLVDYTNTAYFPRNTSSATMQGGIDLIALTGVLSAPNSIILPPVAINIVNDTILNTALVTGIAPFKASAASGIIASYTIQSIPSENEGVLYVCDNGNCTPVTAGQVLTAAQIFMLSFQPNPGYTGDVVFNYFATDTYNQASNVATYTIPVSGQNPGVLPVTMLSFTSSIDNKTVQLNWQTSLEINSSYFEIQRSEDGIFFETFATTTAKGNSSLISNYQTKDDLFFYSKKVVYYRIKMVDIDGKQKFSSVMIIKVDAAVTRNSVKAWPVPFISQLNVEYNSEVKQDVKISLTSISGAVVFNSNINVKQGHNVITINQAQSTPAGTYILLISNGAKTEALKVVKQ